MSPQGRSNFTPQPERVDPIRLTVLLEDAGWRLAGGRRGLYNRLRPPGVDSGSRESLLIPLDSAAADYSELMGAALASLSEPRYRDAWTRLIAPRLTAEAADEFLFRKESSAPSGLISWRLGEELIAAARLALIAGAKAHLESARYFGNRLGQFAKRYMETVYMGQTVPGSYIVTAYAPVAAEVSIRGSSEGTLGIEGIDLTHGRGVTLSIVEALNAATEALSHYKTTGSMAGFEDGVSRGVSYELTSALKGLVSGSDGADISIEWDPIAADPELPGVTHFELSGGDVAALETASSRLVSAEPPRPITVVGRVHLLTRKQAGGPGVVGIETLGGALPRKFRVRMESDQDYHSAVQAHDNEYAVRVSGNLTREGNLNWLLDAQFGGVLGPIDELMQWDRPDPFVPEVDQIDLPLDLRPPPD